MATYNRSRLSKSLEKKNRKSLILNILGIILILGVLIKFGIPLLVNFAVFISGSNNQSQQISKDTHDFISSPILNPHPDATNSARTVISGISVPDATVKLYINGSLALSINTDENGSFSFVDVQLSKGENTIKAKSSVKEGEDSESSEEMRILFKDDPPSLSIENPIDGQSFQKDESSVEVKGKTDPDVKVTINDLWAIIDTNGNFTYTLKLRDGDNPVIIKAVDKAGNTTESKFTVSYSP